MSLILLSGSALALILFGSAVFSWILLLTGRFHTYYIMPVCENESIHKGRFWFLVQSIGLFFAALVVVARTWQYSQGYSDNVMNNLYYAVSAFFLLRAVGEFKHMGLFKSKSQGKFARIDTRIVTPLAIVMFLLSVILL
jgi:hypothetical protein